ncbi:MAG: hypothetical protein QOG53_1486 [Frankiales bacterium]|jgi:hypothetical protein|nr:hypothetical protein [Frankiales bacterium]
MPRGVFGNSRTRAWALVPAFSALTVVAGLLAPLEAQAAQVIPGVYSASVTPTTAVAGSTITYSVKFSNASAPGSLDIMNAASITFPTGFTIVSVPASVNDSQGLPWTVSKSGTTVSLAAQILGVLPGGSVTVPVTAKSPTAAGHYTGSSTAGGLVGGATGTNPFAISGSQPSTDVTPATPAKVVFTQQPSNVTKGVANSPAIKVAIQDAFGNPTTSNANVTLSTSYNPITGNATNPSGNVPQTVAASAGTATFSNVVINDQAVGYKLLASSPGLSSGTSSPFEVYGYSADCAPNTQCDSGRIGNVQDTTFRVLDTKGPANDHFTVTVGGQSAPGCATLNSGTGKPGKFDNINREMLVTIVVNDVVAPTEDQDGFLQWGICFEADHVFDTRTGVATPTGDGHWYGFLPLCQNHAAAPCQYGNLTENSQDDIVGVFKSTPGDPRGMFGIL